MLKKTELKPILLLSYFVVSMITKTSSSIKTTFIFNMSGPGVNKTSHSGPTTELYCITKIDVLAVVLKGTETPQVLQFTVPLLHI